MKRVVLALVLPLAGGCAGTETGNAADDRLEVVSVRFGLVSAAPDEAPRSLDAEGVPFTIDAARAYIRRIDFDLPTGVTCADLAGRIRGGRCEGTELRFEGPWVVDLISGEAVPSMAGLALPAGRYRRVDVRLDKADDDEVPRGDPLADNTLVVEGRFPLNGQETAFSARLRFSEDARFEQAGGVQVGAGGPGAFLLALDPSAWFAGAPLAACAAEDDLEIEDGTLIIADGDGACDDVEDSVKDRIKESGRLEEDD